VHIFYEAKRSLFSIGKIHLNETEFGAALRATNEATGFAPEDYDVFQDFGFVIDVGSSKYL
jgi:hypothetical protein